MEIRQFRVVIRAKSFERTCRFYGEALGFPQLQKWEREDGRGALFQAGPGVVEVLGRPASRESGFDAIYEADGPDHKTTLTLIVPSAEKAYADLAFREKNIPGGLRHDGDGRLVFETHDPDGVKVVFREG